MTHQCLNFGIHCISLSPGISRHHQNHNKKCPKYQIGPNKGNNSGSSGSSSLREDGSGQSADATTTDEDDEEDECDVGGNSSEEDNCARTKGWPWIIRTLKIDFSNSLLLN